MIYVFIALAVIICAVGVVILIKSKKDETKACYRAAVNITNEEILSQKLKNHKSNTVNSSCHPMIYLKSRNDKNAKYVFNPMEPISIGRDVKDNQICVREVFVSHHHCVIYSDGRQVYIADNGAKNPAEIKRGLSRYSLGANGKMQLMTGDKIIVGSAIWKVRIFDYDPVYM